MSNARSPREVCSTTMGTSGLIVLASFASSGGFLPNVATRYRRPRTLWTGVWTGSAAGGPELAGRAGGPVFSVVLVRRPELVPSLGLLDADGLGFAHE